MKTQTMVVIDRTELRKESLRLAARGNELSKKLEEFGEPKNLGHFLDDYLEKQAEYRQLEGAVNFIHKLLEEEEVNPEDYGVPCVTVG